MRNLFRLLILGFSILVGLTNIVLAQGEAGLDIAILGAGVGARPLGMGGAFTAIADNADAPYWNPAGLGFIDRNEITSMQTKLSTDADHYYISYVRPALGGTLGISWIQVGMGNILQTSSEVDANNEVQNLGVFSYFSNAYMLSYGKEINDSISVGIAAKYLTSDMLNINGGSGNGYSLTPGILIRLKGKEDNTKYVRSSKIEGRKVPPTLTVGLKIDELLNQQTWATGTVEQVPPKLRIGVAFRSPNPGMVALDISQVLKQGYAAAASIGYEWAKDALSLRLGYSGDGLTAGAGFISGNARVDYAYVTQANLTRENVHRISLSGIW